MKKNFFIKPWDLNQKLSYKLKNRPMFKNNGNRKNSGSSWYILFYALAKSPKDETDKMCC